MPFTDFPLDKYPNFDYSKLEVESFDRSSKTFLYKYNYHRKLLAGNIFNFIGIKVTPAQIDAVTAKRRKDPTASQYFGGADLYLMKIFPNLKSDVLLEAINFIEADRSKRVASLAKKLSPLEIAYNQMYDAEPYVSPYLKVEEVRVTEDATDSGVASRVRKDSVRTTNFKSATEELASLVLKGQIKRVRAKDSITEDEPV